MLLRAAIPYRSMPAFILSSVLLSPCAAAEAPTLPNEMVVTATRTEQPVAQALSATTVIDRQEISRMQPNSLMDVLRGLPGMSLTNNGGPGKATGIHLRGTETDQVLVLIDGVPVGSATTGGAAIADIPVTQIQRVEIVRGPFSSLYGSEAIGGVIQLFTRRPESSFTPHVSVATGSFGERRINAGVGGRTDSAWYSFSASHRRTDGINAKRCLTPALTCPNPDRDGYRNTSVSLRGGYRFNEAWDARVSLFGTQGHSDYDGTFVDATDTKQRVAGVRVHYRPFDKLKLTAHLGYSADLSDNYLGDVFRTSFDTGRDLASLQADITIPNGLVTTGYDWKRQHINSTNTYAVDERTDGGVFVQWQQQFGQQSFQASVRRDDNEQFGDKTTGSFLWGWEFASGLRLSASYGTAFKAPTFNELYFPGFGNPELNPETSQSVELGVRGPVEWGHWSAHVYQTDIDHMIAYDSATFSPQNIASARIRGVELVVDGQLAEWVWRVSGNWMDPRNLSPGINYDNILPRRARRSLRLDLDRQIGEWRLGGSIYAANARYDDLGNHTLMDAYSLVDLRASWDVTTAWRLGLSVRNVFDREYHTAYAYNQPGRNYRLTVSYRPAL